MTRAAQNDRALAPMTINDMRSINDARSANDSEANDARSAK